jgi:hypothetical protein
MPTIYQTLSEQLEPVIREIMDDLIQRKDPENKIEPLEPAEDLVGRWMDLIEETITAELKGAHLL